jgi:hypothetical protein
MIFIIDETKGRDWMEVSKQRSLLYGYTPIYMVVASAGNTTQSENAEQKAFAQIRNLKCSSVGTSQ